MTKPPELKPCPFCGGAPHIVSHSGDERVGYVTTWVLTCIKCGARKSATDTTDKNGWSNAKPEETKLRAIAAWNNRIPDPAVQALVEAARGLMSALHTTRGTGRITQSVENTLDRIDAALAAFDKTD